MHLTHVCLLQVSDAAAAVYNKIVPSAEAKESEARQHMHRAGDAAEHAGQDLKTSAHELKEAVTDSARGYGRAAQDRCHVSTACADDTCHASSTLFAVCLIMLLNVPSPLAVRLVLMGGLS